MSWDCLDLKTVSLKIAFFDLLTVIQNPYIALWTLVQSCLPPVLQQSSQFFFSQNIFIEKEHFLT